MEDSPKTIFLVDGRGAEYLGTFVDTCGHKGELTYSDNLKKYMCDNCWDEYGEACHNGLA